MPTFIYNLSDFFIFLFVAAFTIIITYVIVLLIKHFFTVRTSYEDNAVIGSVSAVIGVIYGVLAGITALYQLNNIDYTANIVQQEANAVAGIYQDSLFLPQPVRGNVQKQLVNYLDIVVNVEWPLMKHGKRVNYQGADVIEEILKIVHANQNSNVLNISITNNLLTEIKTLYNARSNRIQISYDSLSGEIWVVILIGTFLTIAINYFYKINLRLHILSLFVAILMTSSILFLLITLDKPFQGEFASKPEEFQTLLSYMQQHQA